MKCGESDGGRNRSPEKVSTTLNELGEKRAPFASALARFAQDRRSSTQGALREPTGPPSLASRADIWSEQPQCPVSPAYRSPTGISTATVLPGCASGHAHAGS